MLQLIQVLSLVRRCRQFLFWNRNNFLKHSYLTVGPLRIISEQTWQYMHGKFMEKKQQKQHPTQLPMLWIIFSKRQTHRKCNNHISAVRDVEDGKSKEVRSVMYVSLHPLTPSRPDISVWMPCNVQIRNKIFKAQLGFFSAVSTSSAYPRG